MADNGGNLSSASLKSNAPLIVGHEITKDQTPMGLGTRNIINHSDAITGADIGCYGLLINRIYHHGFNQGKKAEAKKEIINDLNKYTSKLGLNDQDKVVTD